MCLGLNRDPGELVVTLFPSISNGDTYLHCLIYSVHRLFRSVLTMYYAYHCYLYKTVRISSTSVLTVFIIKIAQDTEL